MAFLRNVWYMGGWGHELEEGALLARTILNEPIVFFRKPDGGIGAILDRCPHRFASLHMGKVVNGAVRCGYHGLSFDGTGTCVHNPHGDGSIPRAAHVKSFVAVERDLIIWVWMGEAESADPALIPQYSFLEAGPSTARNTGYTMSRANYLLMSDNIMDLSHVDYLHPDTLGGGSLTRAEASISELGDNSIRISWRVAEDSVPPIFARELPDPSLKLPQETSVVWTAPSYMRLRVDITEAGPPELYVDALHLMTPETEDTTHYFFANVRGFRQDDAEFGRMVHQATLNIFENEDKPMVEEQYRRMGTSDLFSLKPVLLPVDAAALRARRKLDALIAQEQNAG